MNVSSQMYVATDPGVRMVNITRPFSGEAKTGQRISTCAESTNNKS